MTQRTKFVLLSLTLALVWGASFLALAITAFKADQIGLGIIAYGAMALGSGLLVEATRR